MSFIIPRSVRKIYHTGERIYHGKLPSSKEIVNDIGGDYFGKHTLGALTDAVDKIGEMTIAQLEGAFTNYDQKYYGRHEGEELDSTLSMQSAGKLTAEAYNTHAPGEMVAGYQVLNYKEVGDVSYTLFKNPEDGHIVVSFRGTNQKDNWLKRNLKLKPTPLFEDDPSVLVAEGTKSILDELKPFIDSDLQKEFGGTKWTNNVTFTGHSMGGGAAQVALAMFSREQPPQILDCVTYGAPVIGNKNFNESIPSGHIINVVNKWDPVPKLDQVLNKQYEENKQARRELSGQKYKRKEEDVMHAFANIPEGFVRDTISTQFISGLLLTGVPEDVIASMSAGELMGGEILDEMMSKALTSSTEKLQDEAIAALFNKITGGDASVEGIKQFRGEWGSMAYGALNNHPMDFYNETQKDKWGETFNNAREEMVTNYLKNSNDSVSPDFFDEEEFQSYLSELGNNNGEDKNSGDGENKEEDGDAEEDTGGDEEETTDEVNKIQYPADKIVESQSELLGITGKPLECGRTFGNNVDLSNIYCITELGEREVYTGKTNPASTTTLYGKWVGPAPYANDLPVKINGRFSCLDSFGLSYTISGLIDGHHNEIANKLFIMRIKAAINNGYIHELHDAREFAVAHKILDEFDLKGHIFHLEPGSEDVQKGNLLTEIDYAVRTRQPLTYSSQEQYPEFAYLSPQDLERLIENRGYEREKTFQSQTNFGRKRKNANEYTESDVAEYGGRTIYDSIIRAEQMGLEDSAIVKRLKATTFEMTRSYKMANQLLDIIDSPETHPSAISIEKQEKDLMEESIMSSVIKKLVGIENS